MQDLDVINVKNKRWWQLRHQKTINATQKFIAVIMDSSKQNLPTIVDTTDTMADHCEE